MPSSSEPKYVYAGVTRWGGGGSKAAEARHAGWRVSDEARRIPLGARRERFPGGRSRALHHGSPEGQEPASSQARTMDPIAARTGAITGSACGFRHATCRCGQSPFIRTIRASCLRARRRSGVYRSTDGGESWAPVPKRERTRSLADGHVRQSRHADRHRSQQPGRDVRGARGQRRHAQPRRRRDLG